jgi:hypothetical protein
MDTGLVVEACITGCVKNHPACFKVEVHFRPTRLLDLKTLSHLCNFSLVGRADLSSNDLLYVTLSHCWGKSEKRLAATTCSNLTKRYRIILYEEMSLTFRDAIDIARKLGI